MSQTVLIQPRAPADGPRHLNGRLIHAYEQERLRIARELHDDFGQRLASLAIELSALAESIGQIPIDVRKRIAALSRRVGELGSDLHRVSHKLHPARLQQLGLASAIRVFCAELSGSRQMTIEVDTRHVPEPLSFDLALCVYRIAQEALHNVARHSGATTALVTLERIGDDLVLTVTDRGVGFDTGATRPGSSLGLSSMQERVRLVDSELTIQSRKGDGTRLVARVPLQPRGREHAELVRRTKAPRAAGR